MAVRPAALPPLGWAGIVRLGLVQSALGAIVMLVTSLLNRVAVVELALPAMLPGALVGWHYAVQLSRPRFGHGSDGGRRRTPMILAGMALLALGAMVAVRAMLLIPQAPLPGGVLAVLAYTMIGGGVGAAGTSLLALLATRAAPARRPAAAAIAWIMMVAGIVATAGIASQLLDPFSAARLMAVCGGVALAALLLALLAVWGVEGPALAPPAGAAAASPRPGFAAALRLVWAEPLARRFSIFVAAAMLAYSMQDMILEPFAGEVFAMSPGQSTALAGIQHAGVLLGMLLVGALGNRFGRGADTGRGASLGPWVIGGCLLSAVALAGLALAGHIGPGWPLTANVALLGFGNGVFAVAAIGAMMEFAGGDGGGREGVRVGVWGAAQAIAFGLGGFSGAALVDFGRAATGGIGAAYATVFAIEAALFVGAALIAASLGRLRPAASALPPPYAAQFGEMNR